MDDDEIVCRIRLRRCPRCRGKAKLASVRQYGAEGIRACCASCGYSTQPFFIGVPVIRCGGPVNNLGYTRKQAISLAVKEWNRRQVRCEQWRA